jgi:uncharacterized membrane protein YfhO
LRKRKKWAVWAAPLAVLVLLCACFASAGLYPFGTKTLSWCDMNHQTVPLLMDFQDILRGKSSMLLNLQNAGGMSFWGVFFFFLSSPFTFLISFLPKASFYLFMNVLVLLKMSLCACTASILFLHTFSRLDGVRISCLSVMYACSGFALMYYQNIVWLDIACLFPLLVLGVCRLREAEKPALFLWTLSAIIVVDYYLSAMVLFWLVLLFSILSSFVVNRTRCRRQIVLLGLSTGAALLLTAVVWLPSLLQCGRSGRVVDLISSLSSGSILTGVQTTLPVWYCTGAAVAAVPLFFLLKRKGSRQRALFVSYLLLILPLFIDPIDRMWHLGSYQAFPVRFGYILTLTGLLLTGSYLSEVQPLQPEQKSRPLPLFFAGAAAAALIAIAGEMLSRPAMRTMLSHYVNNLWNDQTALQLGLLFALSATGVYLVLFLLFHAQKISVRVLCVLLCVVTAAEVSFNLQVYVAPAASDGHAYDTALDLSGRLKDSSLYRVKTDGLYFDTDLMGALGYPVLDHYTSLTDGTYMDTLQKMGYSAHWMESHSSGGTALTDSLLAQKYSITRLGEENGRTPLYSNHQYSLVRQPYSLPFGFVAQNCGSALPDGDRFGAQDMLYHTFFGRSDSLMTRYSPDISDFAQMSKAKDGSVTVTGAAYSSLLYHIQVTRKTALYFDCYTKASRDLTSSNYNSLSISVNGRMIRSLYPSADDNGLVDLGTFENQMVEVRVSVLHPVNCRSFGVAGMDLTKLQSALQNTQSQAVSLSASGNMLSGTAAARNSGWLVLPLRGGSGFTATVNGKPAQTAEAAGMFLAVQLQAGQNRVEVQYLPPGLAAGAVCSMAGFAAALLFLRLLKKKGTKCLRKLEKPAQVVFDIVTAVVSILLYLFPVAVYLAANLEVLFS